MRKNSKTTQLFHDPVFQQYLRDKFSIDADGNLRGARGRPIYGANAGIGYRIISTWFKGRSFPVLAHRIVMFLHLGRVPGEIDHIDGDRGNNNLFNLREIDHVKNCGRMAKTTRPTSSRYKGVSWNSGNKRWHVMCAGIYIGYFDDEADAAKAYDQAAYRYYGPDAWLNFPPQPRA